jgi:hypothetical protein
VASFEYLRRSQLFGWGTDFERKCDDMWLSNLFKRRSSRGPPESPGPATERPRPAESPGLYSKSLSGSSIRILTILPGGWDEPLKCTLHECPLKDYQAYTALSYTWQNGDDPDPLVQIVCNKSQLEISSNLHSALRQLRQESSHVRIWVDFICINQKDIDERTCQVGIMKEIYARSTDVFIWLGESGPDDHLGELVSPQLTLEERLDLYRWYGDASDYPKLKAYMSRISQKLVESQNSRRFVDVFGALYVLHALASGAEPSDILELRHLSRNATILRGFDALMLCKWVSLSTIPLLLS